MTGRVLDEPAAAQAAAEEGLRIAEAIGDGFLCRQLRYVLAWAQVLRGDLIGCAARLGEVVDECIAANDLAWAVAASTTRTSRWLTSEMSRTRGQGRLSNLERASESLEFHQGLAHAALGTVHLAAGDASAAWEAYEAARERTAMNPWTAGIYTWAPLAPLACGDLAAARRWADDVVSATTGLESGGRVDITLPRGDRAG